MALHVPDCPNKRTLIAYTPDHQPVLMIAVPCLTWTCPPCARAKVRQLIARVHEAKPNHFVTLTTTYAANAQPRTAFLTASRQISLLAIDWRRRSGEFEYVKFLESTAQGWPHFHLMARCETCSRTWLSRTWCGKVGAYIVDVEPIWNTSNVARYAVKYLTKQTSIAFTRRRISWSKKFFPTKIATGQKDQRIFEWKMILCCPEEAIWRHFRKEEPTTTEPDIWKWTLPPSYDHAHALALREAEDAQREWLDKAWQEMMQTNRLGSELPKPVLRDNTHTTPRSELNEQLPFKFK